MKLSIQAESEAVIQNRLLNGVPERYDKSVGSFFYDVLAPNAAEHERLQLLALEVLSQGFADTATGEALQRLVYDRAAVSRKGAIYSSGSVTITGTAGTAVRDGALVASDTHKYRITGDYTVGDGGTVDCVIICTEAGSAGNVAAGCITKFPVTITGLSAVTNAAAIANGYDEETDDELRQRYYEVIRSPATSGNKYHYRNWAMSVTGVGGVKVIPTWNGNGTVKVIIADSNKKAASAALVSSVSDYIENVRPIGATVTVVSASEVTINVAADITLADGADLTGAQSAVEDAIAEYLAQGAFTASGVSIAHIGAVILGVDGVVDYTSLTLNASAAGITLTQAQIAVLGTVTLT